MSRGSPHSLSMRVCAGLILSFVLWACAIGCDKSAAPAASSSGTVANRPAGQPQPKLQTMKLWVGAQELIAELALNDRQRMTGMMFRTNMAENEAMLFVFPVPYRASFYMKNTTVPLSAAYIDPDGTILEIHDLKPLEEKPVEAASDKIQYVLEVNQGWFERNKVGVGMVLRTERGSLTETFFGRR